MPRFDRTGPNGQGPMTGWKTGRCGASAGNRGQGGGISPVPDERAFGDGRGMAFRRGGAGRCHAGRGFRMGGAGRSWGQEFSLKSRNVEDISEQERLQREADRLQQELERVRERLQGAPSSKVE